MILIHNIKTNIILNAFYLKLSNMKKKAYYPFFFCESLMLLNLLIGFC